MTCMQMGCPEFQSADYHLVRSSTSIRLRSFCLARILTRSACGASHLTRNFAQFSKMHIDPHLHLAQSSSRSARAASNIYRCSTSIRAHNFSPCRSTNSIRPRSFVFTLTNVPPQSDRGVPHRARRCPKILSLSVFLAPPSLLLILYKVPYGLPSAASHLHRSSIWIRSHSIPRWFPVF